jgi:DNA-binding XRE family transcriptional regulator
MNDVLSSSRRLRGCLWGVSFSASNPTREAFYATCWVNVRSVPLHLQQKRFALNFPIRVYSNASQCSLYNYGRAVKRERIYCICSSPVKPLYAYFLRAGGAFVNKPIHTARRTPKKLHSKLLAIRNAFGMSQPEFVKLLGKSAKQQSLSDWERGRREPDLVFLLRYSELANVCLNVLIDDAFDLPEVLPAKKPYHRH